MGEAAIDSEETLLAVAKALVNGLQLTATELNVLKDLPPAPADLVRAVRADILAGGDPLGEAFCDIRSAYDRRSRGQTFTPPPIVESMVARAGIDAASNGPLRYVGLSIVPPI